MDRAGFRPIYRYKIVKEMTVEKLNAQLVSIVGENGKEMLISAFKSTKKKSEHEQTEYTHINPRAKNQLPLLI